MNKPYIYVYECAECPGEDHCRVKIWCATKPNPPVQCIYVYGMDALWWPINDGSACRPAQVRGRVRVCVEEDEERPDKDEGETKEDGA